MSDVELLAGAGEAGLVSVVIPTYNRAHLVTRAVESVLNQTHPNVEVIVIDDGSTDSTSEVLKPYASRIRYIRQENTGVTIARNTGLRVARGEFIALLDSDDTWLPWKLSAQLAVLRHLPDVGMVWSDMIAVDGSGDVVDASHLRTMYHAYRQVAIRDIAKRAGTLSDFVPDLAAELRGRRVYEGDIFSPMLLGNLVHTSTVVMRRDRVRDAGLFDERLRPAGEDYEFHLRICSRGRVAFIDAPTMLYRVENEDQITMSARHLLYIARHDRWTLHSYLERERSRVTLSRRQLRRRIASSHAWVGYQELVTGHRKDATLNLMRSLMTNPMQPRTAALMVASLLPPNMQQLARESKKALRSWWRHLVSLTLLLHFLCDAGLDLLADGVL